jgi:hypothetical protein
MLRVIPCTRHGEAGVRDARLTELLELAQRQMRTNPVPCLKSLHYFSGQLWATWKDNASRSEFARAIDKAWREIPETGSTTHLISCDDLYDYQENVMNNADAD